MPKTSEAVSWDAEYKHERYKNEPPVEFVQTILNALGEKGKSQIGMYLGCGNGRNYLPLLDAGLKLNGMDISQEAIDQLTSKRPDTVGKVYAGDISEINMSRVFDYIVAIQVFQHGDADTIADRLRRTSMALKPGGQLFLRVNSVMTEVDLAHHEIESNDQGGKTIVYDEGSKDGLPIHFYSHKELEELAKEQGFEITTPIYGVMEDRLPPRTGSWTQWETIWRKT